MAGICYGGHYHDWIRTRIIIPSTRTLSHYAMSPTYMLLNESSLVQYLVSYVAVSRSSLVRYNGGSCDTWFQIVAAGYLDL
jgi:hypothetical protein